MSILSSYPAAEPGYGLTPHGLFWKHIHVDFAGSHWGHMFFIVVDAHSKWPEVEVMSTTMYL